MACYHARVPPGRIVVARAPFLALVGSLVALVACGGSSDPPAPGTTPVTPVDPGESDGGVEPEPVDGEVPAEPGEVCEDDDGIFASCDGVDGPSTLLCDRGSCERARLRLKSRVARSAIACMKQQIKLGSSCQGCVRLALDEACPDPTTADTCRKVEDVCKVVSPPGVDVKRCPVAIAGMSYGGRTTFLSCATAEGCASPIVTCSR